MHRLIDYEYTAMKHLHTYLRAGCVLIWKSGRLDCPEPVPDFLGCKSKFGQCLPALLSALLISMFTLVAGNTGRAADEAGFAKWEKEIQAFEEIDRVKPPPKGAILFTGSSSIRLWKTLTEDFPDHVVLNRGFGGSQLADVIHFADRIVFPYEPRQIVLYGGANDIAAGKTAQTVLADFQKFVGRVRGRLPHCQILFISVAPNPARWDQVERVRLANQLVRRFTEERPRLAFVDTFYAMLGTDGLPLPDIYVEDRLHMNPKGYTIWREIVRASLKQP